MLVLEPLNLPPTTIKLKNNNSKNTISVKTGTGSARKCHGKMYMDFHACLQRKGWGEKKREKKKQTIINVFFEKKKTHLQTFCARDRFWFHWSHGFLCSSRFTCHLFFSLTDFTFTLLLKVTFLGHFDPCRFFFHL